MSKASDIAYHYIRGAILDGTLPPGRQLAEEYLAEACGVSRTPVREALLRLENEHYVGRTESQRTFVNDWSMNDVEDGFELRGMLEAHAAGRAARLIGKAEIDQLVAYNSLIMESLRSGADDRKQFVEHNRSFHSVVIRAASSPRLSSLLSGLVEQPIIVRTARRYDDAQVLRSFNEHEELILAFRNQDEEWAKAVMSAHIRRAYHTYRDAFLNAARDNSSSSSGEKQSDGNARNLMNKA